MTENEAIKFMKLFREEWDKNSKTENAKASDIAIQALEKQIPKKPYHISPVDDNDNANVECPICHCATDYAINVIKKGHCWKCGQLLDWSDEE